MLMHVWPEEKDSKASRNIIFGHISSRPSESYYVSDHVLFSGQGWAEQETEAGKKLVSHFDPSPFLQEL